MTLVPRNTFKVVFNPCAGNAKQISPESVDFYLKQHNAPYEWVTLKELKTLAQQSQQHHYVLIIGGDGTLHATLNAIGYRYLHKFSFGIIPTGTGNDFARSLQIPFGLEEAFQTVSDGYVGTVDLGVLNNRICFTCATSLGFGSEVTKHATRRMKAVLGRWALYIGAMCYLFRPKPAHQLQVWMDHQPMAWLQTPHLVIGNAKYHGGGFPIAPSADLQNARFDLYYVKPIRVRQLPRLVFNVFFARRDHTLQTEITHRQIQEIQMVLNTPLDVDVDGDIYRFYRRLHAKIYPGKLRVIMPQALALQDKLIKDASWELMSRDSRAS